MAEPTGGSYTPPQFNFGDQIAAIPTAYFAGLDEAYKRRNQDAFKNGIPLGPDGQPDLSAIGSTTLKQGGVSAVPSYESLANLDLQRKLLQQDQANGQFRATGQAPPAAPMTAPPAPTSIPQQPPPTARVPGGDNGQTVVGAVTSLFPQETAGRVIAAVSQRLGYDPNAPLPPDKFAQVQQFVQSVAGARPQQAAPAVPGQLPFGDRFQGQNAPVTRPPTSAEPINDPTSPVPPGVDPQQYLQGLRERARSGTKEGQASTEKEIKNVVEWMRARAGIEIAGRTDEAKKNVETLSKLADDGIDARAHLGQLDAIQQLGQKVGYGIVPKIQSVLGRYGIETKGLSDIQAYERAIDFMGPQLRPQGSGRLLQNELSSFKSALGGLMTTPEGREISINNLKLLSQYKETVGRIASDTSLTSNKRINKIYKLAPPHLQTEVQKAQPGTQAVKTQPVFSSPADVGAAVAAGRLKSGDTFTDPTGKIRRVP